MTKFRSKIDWWLMLIVFAPLLYPIYDGIITEDMGLIATFVVINALIIALFATTNYTIKGDMLIIESGFLACQKVPVAAITSVNKTYNPLSAPALSIKRLEIKYGKNYDYALISPVRRQEFIAELLKINPNIKVAI